MGFVGVGLMRQIKTQLCALVCLQLVLVMSLCHFAKASDIFTIGTGGVAYTYHPVGGMIANAISNPQGSLPCARGGSCGVKDLIAVGITSLGSIDNIRAVLSGKRDSGFAQSDVAYWIYTGTGIMDGVKPQNRLRAIAALYEEHIHLVTLKRDDINHVSDLRGKHVSIDKQGSGTSVDAQLILEASGLYDGDYINSDLSGIEAANALKAGEIDAFFVVAGYPTDLIRELANDVDIKLIPIDGPAADALTSEYGFFALNELPSGTYRGVDNVMTLSVGAIWVTSSRQDQELIYQITKALWNDRTRKLLDVGHARGKDITLDTSLMGIGVPLHKGAARFYQEVGLLR